LLAPQTPRKHVGFLSCIRPEPDARGTGGSGRILGLAKGHSFSFRAPIAILGLPPSADATAVRRAMTKPNHAYHHDKGGAQQQVARVIAVDARSRTQLEGRASVVI
jgi:hypothetical protein